MIGGVRVEKGSFLLKEVFQFREEGERREAFQALLARYILSQLSSAPREEP